MVDSSMWVLGEEIARAATAPAPGWGAFSSRNVYTCQDGHQVTLAATEPRTWAVLCDALGLPELKDHRVGVDDDPPITARLQEVFLTRPTSEWLTTPGLLGGVGPVNDTGRLVGDAHLKERGSLVTLSTSGARVLANPIRYSSARGDEASSALEDPPALGAHTDEALANAGFTTGEIQRLRAGSVVS